MSKDYSDIGLDERLLSKNAIANRRPRWESPLEYGANKDIQVTRVVAGALSIEQLIVLSDAGTLFGTFNLSTSLRAETSLTYVSPHKDKMVMATPYVSFYQGTVVSAANQIWPNIGSNVIAGRYDVQGWYDKHSWNGTSSKWVSIITDTNGTSNQALTFTIQWQQIDYVFGRPGAVI